MSVAAGPQKIMLIRHGEKQGTATPPFGIDENGVQTKHALIPRGWQRAGALVPLFTGQIAREGLAVPSAIFAAAVGSDTDSVMSDGENIAKSLRPQETIAPLAAQLKIDVVTSFQVGDEPKLADAIAALEGVVLVAWEHNHIPLIAAQFTTLAPATWPGGTVFDIVWVLDRMGGAYTFCSVNQSLLAGDA